MPRRRPCLAPPPAPLSLRFRALLGLGFVPPPGPSPARIAPIAPTARRRPRPPLALRRPRALGWQESHRMHPFFAECAREALLLAASARNACFSRSRWQHLRPMHPFPGAIGRFRIHGVRILPPRALFRVEEPEITHGAKMLPAPRGLSAAAACVRPNGLCALRRGPGLLAACAPPAISLVPAAHVHRRRLICVALHRPHRAHARPATRRASPCRAGSAAVPVIPVKWCGDTIAHTRKLRF